MKKQILIGLLFFVCLLAKGQTKTIIDTIEAPISTLYDDSPVGLGVLVADNQKHPQDYPDVLVSKPTIRQIIKNKKGVFYIKAYVNRDHFNIIAKGINQYNYKYYKAYVQSYFTEEIPEINTKWFVEYPFILEDQWNPTFVETNEINKAKFEGFKFLYFIKDIRTGEIVSKMALDFTYPKPEPMFLSSEDYILDTYESKQGEYLSASPEYIDYLRKKAKVNSLDNTFFTANSNLPNRLILPADQNDLLIQFKSLHYGFYNYLEYKLDGDSAFKTSANSRNPFILLRALKPGNHTVQVRYPRQKDSVFSYTFEVKSQFTQTAGFQILVASLFTLFLVGGIFSLKIRRQKKQLKAENAKRAKAQTQIASLRAQLNPHFVFNALNSIQGLVNKNDQKRANIYISKFGSLMRDILDKNDKITHALAQEIKHLESYLQLEQLRFQFKYQIIIDETINPAEQDFPVMLLQPFAENAIKHGIAEKKEAGVISVRFERTHNNLVVVIQDNGKGFETHASVPGYGIKLIKERIAVVNQLYPEQPISCNFKSSPAAGTIVTLLFTNWL